MAKVVIELKDEAQGIAMKCDPSPFQIIERTNDGAQNSAAETYAIKVCNVIAQLVKDGSYNYRAVRPTVVKITIEDTARGSVHTHFEPSLRQIAEQIGVGIVPPTPVQRLARKVAVGLIALSESTEHSAPLSEFLTHSPRLIS